MNTKSVLLLAAAFGWLPVAAHAGVDVAISAEIRLGKVLPPPPPEVVVIEPVGPPGPPPWARTHWFKRSRAYYYYPECGVYYRPADRVWFYLDGGNWRFGASLPASISIDFGRSVSLSLETDRPYAFHEHVVAYYPRGYFTTVEVRGGPPGHQVRHDDHGPGPARERDDHPGKGKGKGKDKGR